MFKLITQILGLLSLTMLFSNCSEDNPVSTESANYPTIVNEFKLTANGTEWSGLGTVSVNLDNSTLELHGSDAAGPSSKSFTLQLRLPELDSLLEGSYSSNEYPCLPYPTNGCLSVIYSDLEIGDSFWASITEPEYETSVNLEIEKLGTAYREVVKGTFSTTLYDESTSSFCVITDGEFNISIQ